MDLCCTPHTEQAQAVCSIPVVCAQLVCVAPAAVSRSPDVESVAVVCSG